MRKLWSERAYKESDMRKANNLKICVITPPFHKSGVSVLLSNLLEILKQVSDEIFVITGNFPENTLNEKIHIQNIKHNTNQKWIFKKVIMHIIMQIKESYKLLKSSKNIDIIIIFLGAILLLPILLTKLKGKKIIIIATGSFSETVKNRGKVILSRIYRILEEINFHLADRIVVESESGIDFLGLNRYKNKIFVSAMGVDINLFKMSEEELEGGRNLIGYIGRFSSEKGVMNFVKAIPLILKERDNLEFLIVGDGPLFDEIKSELKTNEFYDKVKLTGWIDHDKLQDYLNELKLVVLPSYTEGLPNILLEAMACGTPVLATPVGGIPDVIKDGETGFVMENNSPECIAKNIERVFNYPNLDKIAENARGLVEKKYTYEAAVERYKEILEDVHERIN